MRELNLILHFMWNSSGVRQHIFERLVLKEPIQGSINYILKVT